MYNVDMVRFSRESSAYVKTVDDLWSSGYREPAIDDSNDYINKGSYYERKMDTGDDEDFVLECGNVYEF